jgi:hypothetical protein
LLLTDFFERIRKIRHNLNMFNFLEAVMFTLISYLLYLAITLSVTVGVGQSLYRHGRGFLVDAFHENEALADSVNHLLLVGFYLINVGWVCLALRTRHPVDAASAIEILSAQLGQVLVILGGMHFFNIYLFSRFRRSALITGGRPPIVHDAVVSSMFRPDSQA